MKTASQNHGHLTMKEIREIIGPLEMEVLTRTLAIDPTTGDVQIVYKWLRSDEYLVRDMDTEFTGKTRTIYELLDAEFPDLDAFGRGAQVSFATIRRARTERGAVMVNDIVRVVWPENLRRTDVPRVGGKNASLGEMLTDLAGRGVNVPSGFVLTADAPKQFIEVNDLQSVTFSALTDPDDSKLFLAEAGLAIRRATFHGEWPKETAWAIRLTCDELNRRIG